WLLLLGKLRLLFGKPAVHEGNARLARVDVGLGRLNSRSKRRASLVEPVGGVGSLPGLGFERAAAGHGFGGLLLRGQKLRALTRLNGRRVEYVALGDRKRAAGSGCEARKQGERTFH